MSYWYWKISEENGLGYYLILRENVFVFAYFEDDNSVVKAIEERTINKPDIYSFKTLKEVVLIDNDCTLEIVSNKSEDRDEKEITLATDVYAKMKTILLNNLKDVNIKEYSLLKQITPQLGSILIIGFFTFAIYTAAISSESGGHMSTGGRRRFMKKIIIDLGEYLGSIGSLIVGGCLISFVVYLIVVRVKKPKIGNVFIFNKYSSLSIQ